MSYGSLLLYSYRNSIRCYILGGFVMKFRDKFNNDVYELLGECNE